MWNPRELDPVRAAGRRALLEERLLLDPLHETLEDHRPAHDAAERAVRDGEVVADQVELGVPTGHEDHLVRVGDGHLTPGDLQDLRLRHDITIDRPAVAVPIPGARPKAAPAGPGLVPEHTAGPGLMRSHEGVRAA